MTPQQLDGKINRTLAAIQRLDQRIEWLLKKIEYRRRRIRELSKLRSEELNMKLPIE
jgi:hypothetical protein